jgi:uncharacterized protein YjbJ (UPF0337 family)
LPSKEIDPAGTIVDTVYVRLYNEFISEKLAASMTTLVLVLADSKESEMKDKLVGKAEEVKGKVTGDKAEEMKGKARQTVGGVKQTGKELAYDAEHPETETTRGPEEPV